MNTQAELVYKKMFESAIEETLKFKNELKIIDFERCVILEDRIILNSVGVKKSSYREKYYSLLTCVTNFYINSYGQEGLIFFKIKNKEFNVDIESESPEYFKYMKAVGLFKYENNQYSFGDTAEEYFKYKYKKPLNWTAPKSLDRLKN